MAIHWIIVIAVIVIVTQAWIYRRWGMRRVGYERYFDVEHAFVGDEVHLVEVIANGKILPLPWLRLESMIEAGLSFTKQDDLNISAGERYQNHHSLFSLPAYTEIVRKHRITCVQRGMYELKSATLTCGDLFNIYSHAVQLELEATLLVFPRLLDLEELSLPSHSWQGDHIVRRWIVSDPFIVAGVREYRAGDPLNRINWKATARTGELQVHHDDYTAQHRLMVLLNFDVSEEMWSAVTDPELIEHGISLAASLAQLTIQRGIETGFACNGYAVDQLGPRRERSIFGTGQQEGERRGRRLGSEAEQQKRRAFETNEQKRHVPVYVPPHIGRAHFMLIMEQMAKLDIARTTDFPTFLEQRIVPQTTEATDFLIITAFESERMQEQIERLRQRGHAVELLHLSAPQEEAMTG